MAGKRREVCQVMEATKGSFLSKNESYIPAKLRADVQHGIPLKGTWVGYMAQRPGSSLAANADPVDNGDSRRS